MRLGSNKLMHAFVIKKCSDRKRRRRASRKLSVMLYERVGDFSYRIDTTTTSTCRPFQRPRRHRRKYEFFHTLATRVIAPCNLCDGTELDFPESRTRLEAKIRERYMFKAVFTQKKKNTFRWRIFLLLTF